MWSVRLDSSVITIHIYAIITIYILTCPFKWHNHFLEERDILDAQLFCNKLLTGSEKLFSQDQEIDYLPGKVADLFVAKITSWWRWWLHFPAGRNTASLVSQCSPISKPKPAKLMCWSCWTRCRWQFVLQMTSKLTRPDCLWLFPLGIRHGRGLPTSLAPVHWWTVEERINEYI